MNEQFNVRDEYEKDRLVVNEERTLWVGIFIMVVVIILDFMLFNWIQ